jgi:hypothetical protein
LNREKQHKKLIKLVNKAEKCASRKEAQKLLKKAEKVELKLN